MGWAREKVRFAGDAPLSVQADRLFVCSPSARFVDKPSTYRSFSPCSTSEWNARICQNLVICLTWGLGWPFPSASLSAFIRIQLSQRRRLAPTI